MDKRDYDSPMSSDASGSQRIHFDEAYERQRG